MNRRVFLMCGSGVLAAQVPPSRQVVVGLIGAGARGMQLLRVLLNRADVRIGAVCETYEPRMFEAVAVARSKGHRTRYYRLYRDLLADTSLEAVVIATPDFWHSQMTLEALEQGKDVYVEQPLCHSWQEGVAMIAAQSRSRQIVQVGSQRRSSALLAALVHNGQVGRVRRIEARATTSYLRPGVMKRAPAKLSEPLNFEDWQAGAEKRVAYNPDRFVNWRFYSSYGGGCVTDLGTGLLDCVHMIAGLGFPLSVLAQGTGSSQPGFDTAEQAIVKIEYPDGITASVSLDGKAARRAAAVLVRTDRGDLRVNELPADDATAAHLARFIDCVRSRATPNASPETVFPATLACQMANLSIATGRPQRWLPEARRVESA